MKVKSVISFLILILCLQFLALPVIAQKQGKKVSRKEYNQVVREKKKLENSLRETQKELDQEIEIRKTETQKLSADLQQIRERLRKQVLLANSVADSLMELARNLPDSGRATHLVALLNRKLGPITGRSFDLERNLSQGSQKLEFLKQNFNIFIVDMDSSTVKLHWQNADGENYSRIDSLKSWLKNDGQEPLMITNGGMYTPAHSPQGLYFEDNQERVEINTTDGGSQKGMNFFMLPNGVFGQDEKGFFVDESREFVSENLLFATQSGPMLIKDWEMHPKFNQGSSNKYIRSGVGIINSRKCVFVISRRPVNFYDFASLFLNHFGCRDALYLDGAISKMWIKGLNKSKGGNFGPIISVVKK